MEAEYEWLNALRQSRRCGAEKKQHKLREEQAEGSSKSQQPQTCSLTVRISEASGVSKATHGTCQCSQQLQQCLTCDPMDCSPPGSSVHGLCQARILEWVAMPSSRGSSQARDRTRSLTSSALAGGFFTTSSSWEAHSSTNSYNSKDQLYCGYSCH